MTGSSPRIEADSDLARANAEIIAAFFREVLSGGPAAVAATFLSPDFCDHDPAAPGQAGPEGVAAKIAGLWQAFPDGRFVLEEIVAAGDRVAARSRLIGTQTGPFGPLPPSGRRVDVAFFDLYRVAEGRIAEHWHSSTRRA